MIKISIDNRECDKVVAEFVMLQEELEKKGELLELEVSQLICGDVVCGDVCIERKEAGDFVASIIDKRLKEQVAKMSLNYKHNYIILVGDIWATQSAIYPRAIVGMQCALAVRHNIKFIHARNNEEFVWCCYSIFSKILDGEVFKPEEHRVIKYDVSREDRLVSCLAATGIGVEKAKAIVVEYPTMTKIINCLPMLHLIDGVGQKTVDKLSEVLIDGERSTS